MRISGALAGLLVLLGVANAGPPPATAPAPKIYTLGNDNNERLATHPTAQQIKAALASIDGDKIHCVYINCDPKHCIQANWEAANELSFQYVDGGDEHMYETHSKAYSRDVALKLLLSYMIGKEDWLKMVDWQPMK